MTYRPTFEERKQWKAVLEAHNVVDMELGRFTLGLLEMLNEVPVCGVCTGRPLASGKPCICGGVGTEHAEFEGIRKRLVEIEIALGYFINLPPQTSSAYAEVCEMIESLGYSRDTK